MIRFKMGDKFNITKNFQLDEFSCKCGECKASFISKALLNELQWARLSLGLPIHINSGYRCEIHNYEVGGAEMSWHKSGHAADIRCDDLPITLFLIHIQKFKFDVIIPYLDKGFIHVVKF